MRKRSERHGLPERIILVLYLFMQYNDLTSKNNPTLKWLKVLSWKGNQQCRLLGTGFYLSHHYSTLLQKNGSHFSHKWLNLINSRISYHCLCMGKSTLTHLCVHPLLHIHGSTRHVIDLILDVGHGFVCAPDDTHNGNLRHRTWTVIQQWDQASCYRGATIHAAARHLLN